MKRSTALLFALGLILLMVVNGRHFFFYQPYYEFWDTATNSLAVDHAKHFAEMYGNYSRWLFRHPGPAFFYVDAFGEWLFYDMLHAVPTPYNGQLLINLCLMVGFFVTALRLFTLWLPHRQRGAFLFVAVAVGIVHFGSMSVNLPAYDILRGSSAFLSTWPPHVLALPLLCLLTAGASVAAGRGGDLPLLALADGFLIHGHVAQPLFVVPVSLLAYAGLLGSCVRREPAPATSGTGRLSPRRVVGWLGSAWRAYRGAHLGALALALFFALPLIIDVFRGADSNLAAIFRHMHAHRHEHKTLARSLMYFLQYGAYTAYRPDSVEFGEYDAAGAWAYLREHALIYAAWLAAAMLACWAIVAHVGSLRRGAPAALDAGSVVPPSDADGRRFLAWAAVFLALAVGLTLYWGTIQDGDMFFFNAVFNFGIYYFAALLAAAVLAGWPWLGWVTGGGGWQGRPRVRAALAGALLALLGFQWADRFRLSDSAPETTRAMHEAVARVLAATAPRAGETPPLAVLRLPWSAWPAASGLAIAMRRAGRPFAVETPGWVFFNEFARLSDVPKERLRNARTWRFELLPTHEYWEFASRPLARQQAIWRTELDAARSHPTPGSFELVNGVVLTLPLPGLDPAGTREGAAEVRFTPGGNGPEFILAGLGTPEGFGAWTDDHTAILRFVPAPVTGEAVEMTLAAIPFLAPEAGLKVQRVRLLFNGVAVGPEQRLDAGGMLQRTFTIPAALWNHAAAPDGSGTSLLFEFPDATSPDAVSQGRAGDNRLLALGLNSLRFRVVPAVSGAASTPRP